MPADPRVLLCLSFILFSSLSAYMCVVVPGLMIFSRVAGSTRWLEGAGHGERTGSARVLRPLKQN